MSILTNRQEAVAALASRWLLVLWSACMLQACGGGDESVQFTQPAASAAAMGATTSMAGTVPAPRQGAIVPSSRSLDLAIAGDGMFIALDESKGEPVYSRIGRLDMTHDGTLIDIEGRRLMGRQSDADPATVATPLAPIPLTLAPHGTRTVSIEMNLDARDIVIGEGSIFRSFQGRNLNFSHPMGIFDPSGRQVTLRLSFRQVSDLAWDLFVTAPGELNGDRVSPAARLVFWPSGELRSGGVATIPPPWLVVGDGGPNSPNGALTFDLRRVTRFGAPYVVTESSQDGYAAGVISALEVSSRGKVTAFYDNGQRRPAGQILLAKFTLADRFSHVGDYGYRCGLGCADPVVEQPGVRLLGNILGCALEQ